MGVFATFVSEWDRENCLAGEREEREGNVREKSGLGDWFGAGEICFVGDGTCFLLFCGEGMFLRGDEGCLAGVRG